MTSYNVPFFYQRFYDNNGLPLAGGRIYTFVAGTSIPKPIYHDNTLVDPITQPMILDANGVAPEYFAKTGMYKFEIRSSEDELVATRDYIIPSGGDSAQIDVQDIAYKSRNNIFIGENTFSAGLSATEVFTQDLTVSEDLIIDPASNGRFAFPQKDTGFLKWDTGLGNTITVPEADLPFVDKTSDENIAGVKTFTDGISTESISADNGLSIQYTQYPGYNINGSYQNITLQHPQNVTISSPLLNTSGINATGDVKLNKFNDGLRGILSVDNAGTIVRGSVSASEIISTSGNVQADLDALYESVNTFDSDIEEVREIAEIAYSTANMVSVQMESAVFVDQNYKIDPSYLYPLSASEIISDSGNVQSDIDNIYSDFVPKTEKGMPNGVAELDGNGLIYSVNIPSIENLGGISSEEKGMPNGIAELDGNGLIYPINLPPIGDFGGISASEKGAPNGVAELDADGYVSTPAISIDTTANVSVTTGQIAWNANEKTFDLGLEGGSVLQVGQELLLYGHNETGSTISNGQAVYLTSAGVADGSLHFAIPSKNNSNTFNTIAIATQDILDGESGYVTKYGKVRDIDTSAFTEGGKVYLGNNGALSPVQAVYPDHSVELGYCVISHPTSGSIYVDISSQFAIEDLYNVKLTDITAGDSLIYEDNKWINRNFGNISKEYTGFKDPGLVTVDYNPSTRRITLGGSVEAYYRSKFFPTLSAGWVSEPHPANPTSTQFLMYDGTDILFSSTPFDFSYIQIAAVVFAPSGEYICTIREPHGVLQWQAHQEFHDTIGTYLKSGGDISSFVLNSTNTANRRPDISTTVLHDEDLPTTNSALTSKIYSRFSLSGSNTMVFSTDTSEIINVTGNQPNYNEFSGSTWVQTPFPVNSYGSIFIFAIPSALDTKSQKLRYVFVQPQTVSTTLATIEALTPNSVNLASFSTLNPEIVFVGKIIVRYTAGNWSLISVEKLSGSRISQTSSTGIYLSIVTTDTTLSGLGTAASPLGIDLADFGTW